MSGWKANDLYANNEPSYLVHIGRSQPDTNTYQKNTVLVTSSRLANANTTLTGMKKNATAHAGWVNYSVGTGGRAGRIQTEVLVALSTPSSANANAAQPFFTGI